MQLNIIHIVLSKVTIQVLQSYRLQNRKKTKYIRFIFFENNWDFLLSYISFYFSHALCFIFLNTWTLKQSSRKSTCSNVKKNYVLLLNSNFLNQYYLLQISFSQILSFCNSNNKTRQCTLKTKPLFLQKFNSCL